MKNFYLRILFLLSALVFQLCLPDSVMAQCTCSGGLPATPVTQSISIAPVQTSTLNFTFNQFDPSVGTLTCISFVNAISGTSYTGARNTGIGNDTTGGTMHIDSTAFLFSLSLNTKLAGPGVTVNRPFNTMYGYDTLRGRDTVNHIQGDTITYGPTNFITNPITTVWLGGLPAYIGMGTVNFALNVNGGMITLDGGANYKSSVTTIIGGQIDLTYYYCPASVLASGLQHFKASKKDNKVLLTWDVPNNADLNEFEVEYSADGQTFATVGKVKVDANSNTTSYSYSFALNGSNNGYGYFRIRQTDNAGTPGYSAVQKIALGEAVTNGISIRPNPIVTGMSLTFEQPLTGDYTVDLLNTAGQTVYSKKFRLSNSNTIPVNLNAKPAPGIYFTRITNMTNNEQRVARVVVQ